MPEVEKRFQKRQIAYKIGIKDILNSKYIKTQGLNPNYLEINGQEISRVNIIGVVVQKSEIDNYRTITIDDGAGKITARDFENVLNLDKVDVGNFVLMIGRPREFSNEKYILLEIINKIDVTWARVRKLELKKGIKSYKTNSDDNGLERNKIVDEIPKSRILKLIKEMDKGGGVSIDDISSKSFGDADKIVNILLKEGDIFEINPGRLKVLE